MVALAEAPSSPRTLYAVSRSGRLYASTDGGAAWRLRAPAPEPGERIVEAVADPFDAQTVYARTIFAGLLRSHDGGRSWSRLAADLPYVEALTAETGRPGVFWAATLDGLHRSSDGGETWQAMAFPGRHLLALAIDPGDASTFLAAESTGDFVTDPIAVWRSLDQGATWQATPLVTVPDGAQPGQPRFVFDPAHPGTAYTLFIDEAGLRPLFRTADRGASWTELPAALGVRDLAPSPDGVLVAATGFGTARSSDQGATWLPPLPLSAATATAPKDTLGRLFLSAPPPGTPPGALLAAGEAGIWKSGDGGGHWAATNRGIVALEISSLTAAPAGPSTLTTVAGNGVFRSTDRGTTWTRVHADIEGPQPLVLLAVHPRRPRTLYGIGSDGQADVLLESRDGGRRWEKLPVPFACGSSVCAVTISAVALDPSDPDTILVSGYHFEHFGGQGPFLLRSDDGFQTWTSLAPLFTATLLFDPIRPGTLYGLTCKRFFKSDDGGKSWRRAGRGLPFSACKTALVIDPRDPRRLWVGTYGKGVFTSSDGGETFRAMNNGLEAGPVVSLVIDPADPDRLFAGVLDDGVYRWNAARRRWTPLRQGLQSLRYKGILALDPQRPAALFAVHPDQGILRLDLEETEP